MSARNNTLLQNIAHKVVTGAVVIVMCLLSAGCSPELVLGSAIALSLLSAQEYQNNSTTNTPQPRIRTIICSNNSYEQTIYPSSGKQPDNRSETYRTSQADEQQPAYTLTITKAIQAYKALQRSESTRLLKKAIAIDYLPNAEKYKGYTFLGAIAYQQGHTNDAKNYFKKAVELDSTAIPSEELFPPPMIEFYKSIAKR